MHMVSMRARLLSRQGIRQDQQQQHKAEVQSNTEARTESNTKGKLQSKIGCGHTHRRQDKLTARLGAVEVPLVISQSVWAAPSAPLTGTSGCIAQSANAQLLYVPSDAQDRANPVQSDAQDRAEPVCLLR